MGTRFWWKKYRIFNVSNSDGLTFVNIGFQTKASAPVWLQLGTYAYALLPLSIFIASRFHFARFASQSVYITNYSV